MILHSLLLSGAAVACAPAQSDATKLAFEEARSYAGSDAEVDATASALVAMPGAAEALLEVWGSSGPSSVDGRLLERTAALLDRRAAVSAVRSAHVDRPDPGWRATALVLLEPHARRSELELLAALASAGAPDHRGVLDAFQGTLTALLQRDPDTDDWLYLTMQGTVPSRLRVLRAVGAAGEPDRIEWLSEWLGDARLASVALQEIGRLARLSWTHSPVAAARVRARLRDDDPSVRRQALTAVRALGDVEAVPELIGSTDSCTEDERRRVFGALRDLTDRKLPDRAEAWHAWYEAEVAWWDERAPVALEDLSSSDHAVVVAALRALSVHWIHRDRVASEVGRLAEQHEMETIRVLACSTLQQLGSMAAFDHLLSALDDPSEPVRERAHAALCAVTGHHAPPDPDAWRAEFPAGE